MWLHNNSSVRAEAKAFNLQLVDLNIFFQNIVNYWLLPKGWDSECPSYMYLQAT